jgi:predicted DNA-binding protein
MSSTTLRVSVETRDRVNALRHDTGQSTDELLRRALDAYERALFWEGMRRAHAALTPQQRAQEDADRRSWEATLKDGLNGTG